jgi:hypothetical protein
LPFFFRFPRRRSQHYTVPPAEHQIGSAMYRFAPYARPRVPTGTPVPFRPELRRSGTESKDQAVTNE